MSEFIYQDPDTQLNVVSYAGPARADGGPRKRYQISNYIGADFSCVTVSTEEWERLAAWIKQTT